MRIWKIKMIDLLSKESGLPKKVVRRVYDALGTVMMEQLEQENEILLFPGMVIYGKRRPSRMWENPLIGGVEEIKECVVPKVKFTDVFRKALKEATIKAD